MRFLFISIRYAFIKILIILSSTQVLRRAVTNLYYGYTYIFVRRDSYDSDFVRSVLIYDESPRKKPRLSWYDPQDDSWIPQGWYTEGLKADLKFYFNETHYKRKNIKHFQYARSIKRYVKVKDFIVNEYEYMRNET